MSIWATDIPGYRGHRVVSDRESVWRLVGDVGMLSREVDVRVLITEWTAPSRVSFTLEGVEEPVEGKGSFTITADATAGTTLDFALELSAGGPLGPVINVLLAPMLGRVADAFVSRLADRLAPRSAA